MPEATSNSKAITFSATNTIHLGIVVYFTIFYFPLKRTDYLLMTIVTRITASFIAINLLCELFNYMVLRDWLDLPYLNMPVVSDVIFIVYVLFVFLALDFEIYQLKEKIRNVRGGEQEPVKF